MILTYILFIVGIVILIKGADYLVEGSSSLAKRMGMSPFVVGLTIVAFGTSMPEFLVNITAAFQGVGDIAFGNVIGSNLSNILLILGISAIIYPIKVESPTIWKEIPFSLVAVIVLMVFSNMAIIDGVSTNTFLRSGGIMLMLFFAIFLYYIIDLAKRRPPAEKQEVFKPFWKMIGFVFLGLVGLYFGGTWTVDGAVAIARQFGLSEFLVSATIIAIGTSLPELVTSVTAALKKNAEMAIGNVVGSNIFNIFLVLGITTIIKPIDFPDFALVDLGMLFFATLLLFCFMFLGKKRRLDRWQGIVFVTLYIIYIVYLIFRG